MFTGNIMFGQIQILTDSSLEYFAMQCKRKKNAYQPDFLFLIVSNSEKSAICYIIHLMQPNTLHPSRMVKLIYIYAYGKYDYGMKYPLN